MKKKILMTTMSLDIGGAETHIAELCKALAHDGYDVTVASGGGVYVESLQHAGVKHVTLPLATKNPLHVIRAYRGLKQLIRKERFDVVHAHARIPAFICGLLSKRLGFRFATTAHGTFAVTPLWRLITNWGEKILSVSYDIKDYLIHNYGIPSDNISLTVNGIDTERFSPEADADAVIKEFGLSPSEHRLLYVSRIDKGTAYAARALFDAVMLLIPDIPDLQVMVVGDGDDFAEVSALAEQINRDAGRPVITLAGRRTDVENFCAWGQTAVGVSRAVLEAMSAGCLALLQGAQGALGIFNETTLDAALKTNFTCRGYECADGASIAKDLRTLFTLPAEEKERLQALCRSTVKNHYSIRRMAMDAEEMYDSLTPSCRYKRGDIVIGGYYGFSNLGDDSLLQVIVDQLRCADPDARITVLSRNPKGTKKAFLVHSVGRFNPFGVYRALKGAKLLIFGGGSQLQSVTSSRSLTYYLYLLRAAQSLGVKTVLFANGIGPFSGEQDEERVARVLKRADLITLRDSRSLEKLHAMGVSGDKVRLSADPAFLMREADSGWCEHLLERAGLSAEKGYYVISLRAWRNLDPAIQKKISVFCRKISESAGLTPVFLPMQTERDLSLCRTAAENAGGILLEELSPSEARTVIAGAQFVCGMRLHLLIYAVAAGVPALALSYDPKIDAFFDDLNCPYVISAAKVEVEKLVKYADEALSADRRQLMARAETFREKARISMELTKDLL